MAKKTQKVAPIPRAMPGTAGKGGKPMSRGGDRKTQDFHMERATHHMVQALGKRMAERDK